MQRGVGIKPQTFWVQTASVAQSAENSYIPKVGTECLIKFVKLILFLTLLIFWFKFRPFHLGSPCRVAYRISTSIENVRTG